MKKKSFILGSFLVFLMVATSSFAALSVDETAMITAVSTKVTDVAAGVLIAMAITIPTWIGLGLIRRGAHKAIG